MPKLGVNIDHVATLREARYRLNRLAPSASEPDPVLAAKAAQKAGCDSIVCHLRMDRRHIQDSDLARLRSAVKKRLNLEMSTQPEIVRIALRLGPDEATLVPEKREEVTTEGGLDVARGIQIIRDVVRKLKARGIVTSLFVDPDRKQIEASRRAGADFIELHTGCYANARTLRARQIELNKLKNCAAYARKLCLGVNAGHGLTYENVEPIAKIKGVEELNIGHSIIARAVFVGIYQSVKEMRALVPGTTPVSNLVVPGTKV